MSHYSRTLMVLVPPVSWCTRDVLQTFSLCHKYFYYVLSRVYLYRVCGNSNILPVLFLFYVIPQHTLAVNGKILQSSDHFPSVLSHCMISPTMFLTYKRDIRIKGWICVYGRKQCASIKKKTPYHQLCL